MRNRQSEPTNEQPRGTVARGVSGAVGVAARRFLGPFVAIVLVTVLIVGCDNAGNTATSTPLLRTISGRLGSGSSSGPEHVDCEWVITDRGEKVEVIFPDGWRVEFHPLRVIDTKGNIFATAGDRLQVLASVGGIGSSLCTDGYPVPAISVRRIP